MTELLTTPVEAKCDHDWSVWVADGPDDVRFCIYCGLEERRFG